MLDKFEITKNLDNSFTVESKVNGNIATVIGGHLFNDSHTCLLWTILNDLKNEGLICAKNLND